MGSYAVGMTAQCPYFPIEGQTVKGTGFSSVHGGKGSNQAVAAARMGGDVIFCTCLGKDMFGENAKKLFKQEGFDTRYVKESNSLATGAGVVFLDEKGHNEIVIVLGANEDFSLTDVEKMRKSIENASVVLLQLEFNLLAIEKVIQIAHDANVPIILNPAPFQKIPDSVIRQVSYLVPNETEAFQLLGLSQVDEPSVMARKLYDTYGCSIIITTGKNGCYVKTTTLDQSIETYPLKPVDTTGAGDTFCGAFACSLSSGKKLLEAIDVALAASSLSVTKFGVVESIPTATEVEKLIKEGKK